MGRIVFFLLLAIVGWRAGREAHARPWASAATFVVAGLLLVVAAIAPAITAALRAFFVTRASVAIATVETVAIRTPATS